MSTPALRLPSLPTPAESVPMKFPSTEFFEVPAGSDPADEAITTPSPFVGDQVTLSLAEILSNLCRPSDLVIGRIFNEHSGSGVAQTSHTITVSSDEVTRDHVPGRKSRAYSFRLYPHAIFVCRDDVSRPLNLAADDGIAGVLNQHSRHTVAKACGSCPVDPDKIAQHEVPSQLIWRAILRRGYVNAILTVSRNQVTRAGAAAGGSTGRTSDNIARRILNEDPREFIGALFVPSSLVPM